MSRLISDYIKVYSNQYTQEELDLVINESKDFIWEPHKWAYKDTPKIDESRKSNELDMAQPTSRVAGLVNKNTRLAREKYASEIPYGVCNEMSQPRFNRYTENTDMRNHVDHIHVLFDGKRKGIPILSIVTVFNDDYEGGDFIFNKEDKVELNAGDILIFPSVFLFAHKVDTVTKGVRLSAVQWAW